MHRPNAVCSKSFSRQIILSLILCSSPAAVGHVGPCARKQGAEQLRCERHMQMAEKCGPLKGDAHFACDREFLLANPLVCQSLSGKAAEACLAEVRAFKTCQPQHGRDFMKCVKDTTGESPMGHYRLIHNKINVLQIVLNVIT